MLTLNRKEGQAVYIGEDVVVVVKRIIPLADGRFDVKLGFDAPLHVTIDREEVRERRIKNMDRAFNGNSR